MSKLTREEFRALRTRAEHDLAQSREVPSILICAGTGCIAGGAMKIYDNFKSECEARGLKVYVGLKHDTDEEKSLHVKMSGCHGFCEMGPLVHIEPMGVMYIHVKPEDCHEILEKTVLGGEVIDRLVYHLDGTAYPKQEDIPFYKKQHRVVLENCGTSDAEDIEEYIAKGGYAGFERALFEMTDEEVCQEILTSGLRGRGGGGYVHYHGGAGAVLPAVPEQHSGNHDNFGHEGLREGGKTHEKNEEVPPDGAGGAGHFLLLRGSLGGRRAALHDVQLRLLGRHRVHARGVCAGRVDYGRFLPI